MKTIYIIDGTSGIWKSDLISYLSACKIKSDIFLKSSTRERRPEEKVTDLRFLTDSAFASCNFDFQYVYDDHKYGFNHKDIEELLNKVDNLFIVIRNLDLIKEVKKRFSTYNIVTVFIYTDFHVVSKRLPNSKNVQYKKSIENAFQDYLSHPDAYDKIIINGGTARDFNRLIDILVAEYSSVVPKSNVQIKSKVGGSLLKLGKTFIGRILFPIIITTFTSVIMFKYFVGELNIFNPLIVHAILIISSLLVYFIPQLVFWGLVKTKEQFDKHKTWFEYIHIIIAIIVYLTMFFFYTIANK